MNRTGRTTRRTLLAAAATTAAGVVMKSRADVAAKKTTKEPFGYCLNTSTLRGQNLPIQEEIDIAAKVGFGAIEPWINELDKHVKSGNTLTDLRKQISDHGLKVPSAIGFAEWIVDDDAKRAKALEQMKRDMDAVSQIGGARIAAPAAGVKAPASAPPHAKVVERFKAILDLGRKMGVTPELELWGFSPVLSRLGEVASVAIDTGDDSALLLLDVYHLYKGGNDFAGIHLLNGQAMSVLHMNDYPDVPRSKIDDSYRVYPGDGVAPLPDILKTLRDINFTGYLSVELFNKDYWRQSPLKVAKAAFEKTKAAVLKANL
jgi:sugar phosphate isomerase/epimerase